MFEPPSNQTSSPAYVPEQRPDPPVPDAPPAKPRKVWPWIAGVAAAIAVGAGGMYLALYEDDQPKTIEAASVPEETTPAAPSPTPTVEPTQAAALGRPMDLEFVKVTVCRYRPLSEKVDGRRLGSVEVRTCNTSTQAYEVSAGPWALLFADDSVSDGGKTWTGFTSPEYPILGRKLNPGKCVRGWMTFELSGAQKPVAVEYAPDGLTESEEAPTVTWPIK